MPLHLVKTQINRIHQDALIDAVVEKKNKLTR